MFWSEFLLGQNQHSVARRWNELLLESIRGDFAKPTIHAKNLFYLSAAMYDAWAIFEPNAKTYFLGNTINGFDFTFEGFKYKKKKIADQRNEAISYAMYRLLNFKFRASPGRKKNKALYDKLMIELGYDISFTSINYLDGSSAALGNFIADRVILYSFHDGSRENATMPYSNAYYKPVNPPLDIFTKGNNTVVDPNKWQPLRLAFFIDQNGNQFSGNIPPFLSAEWGNIPPFALTENDKKVYSKNGRNYTVYLDPGFDIKLDTSSHINSALFKESHEMVLRWSSHLDPSDSVMIDISPGSIGNIDSLPVNIDLYKKFYAFDFGGDNGKGHKINPITKKPYMSQIVPRGDFTRVLAEFWADGPSSETPPGHWFSILNYVSDHPLFQKKLEGKGKVLDDLEWDVKTYFILGGAMHDAAIAAWSIKGWYDTARPFTVLRYMAMKGQCSDPELPHYHEAGLKLSSGFIELIMPGDSLAGTNNENLHKIKVKAWKGHSAITDPKTDVAGVGWVLAEQWWPYQRQTFVTPPFAGYVSGHSTYSRAAADIMTAITGDSFFPGGLGEFYAKKNEYLVFEDGPSQDITLQWATYRDASDQCSLSRIWGGIHPTIDDIPGRKIGEIVAKKAFAKAMAYFDGKK